MKKTALYLLTASLSTPALAVDSYTIDPNHTLPLFEVNHLGFSTQRGRFEQVSGKVSLDRAKSAGYVELTIQAASISMGQEKWNEHLRSPDFFNVAKFPTISFKSDKISFKGGVPVEAEGELSMLGVTKPVKLKIHHFTCGENPINKKSLCAADIDAVLKRSEFGMLKYLPGISDEIKVEAPIEAYKD